MEQDVLALELQNLVSVVKLLNGQLIGLHNRIVDLETDRDEQDRRVTNLECNRRKN